MFPFPQLHPRHHLMLRPQKCLWHLRPVGGTCRIILNAGSYTHTHTHTHTHAQTQTYTIKAMTSAYRYIYVMFAFIYKLCPTFAFTRAHLFTRTYTHQNVPTPMYNFDHYLHLRHFRWGHNGHHRYCGNLFDADSSNSPDRHHEVSAVSSVLGRGVVLGLG